jgi:uncharacterized protein YbaR (Trm112 family)
MADLKLLFCPVCGGGLNTAPHEDRFDVKGEAMMCTTCLLAFAFDVDGVGELIRTWPALPFGEALRAWPT